MRRFAALCGLFALLTIALASGSSLAAHASPPLVFPYPDIQWVTIGQHVHLSFCHPVPSLGKGCGGPFVHNQKSPRGGSKPGPYIFTRGSGFLPPGLVLRSNGLVTGTVKPTQNISTVIEICVRVFATSESTCQEVGFGINDASAPTPKHKPSTTPTTTTTPVPTPAPKPTVTPSEVTLGSAGGCAGGTLSTTIQITASSNVTWTVRKDANSNDLGQVVAGSGTGSEPFTVMLDVASQKPTFDCSHTVNMSESTVVDVTFSDGTLLGVTLHWTYVYVE